MTKLQATALQAEWKKQVHPVPCEHLELEMENTVTGHLTGLITVWSAGKLLPTQNKYPSGPLLYTVIGRDSWWSTNRARLNYGHRPRPGDTDDRFELELGLATVQRRRWCCHWVNIRCILCRSWFPLTDKKHNRAQATRQQSSFEDPCCRGRRSCHDPPRSL